MTTIVAEIGNSHEGNLDEAFKLIEHAAEAGADVVKFQMFRADTLCHHSLRARVGTGFQRDRMRKLEFSDSEWYEIIQYARSCPSVSFAASVFDEHYLKFADFMHFIKIASGDAMHGQLVRAAYATGKPLVISAGLVTNDELGRYTGFAHDRITILHCVSEYPCAPAHVALSRMRELQERGWHTGYSDHCIGINACLAAAALGAEIIEKHFTAESRGLHLGEGGGDHIHAATPTELADMVSRIRQIELMSGPWYKPDGKKKRALERGGYAARDLAKGETIGESDVIALRPRVSRHAYDIIGTRATRAFSAGESLDENRAAE